MSMVRDVKCYNKIGCVSSLGMGTWGIGGGYWSPDYSMDKEWVEALRTGIQLGMTLIDTAEMYGGGHAEEIVGAAIKGFKREDLFIVSKVWPTNAAYENVLRSATASSKRLGTYIDLYLLHWPSDIAPVCETIRAFEKLVDSGVIRFYGLSNFSLKGIEEARTCAKKSASQVALNWLICIDNVVPIPKASNIDHVKENAGAMGWRLSKEDWLEISRLFGSKEKLM